MNATNLLDKSLAWSFFLDPEHPGSAWDIAGFLNTLGIKTQSQLIGLELADQGYLCASKWYDGKRTAAPVPTMSITGKHLGLSEEVHALTQVILHTLNSDPEKHHDLSEIPGLEAKAWSQLSEFAQYLVRQGWIEACAKDDKLFAKLTIKGSIYLRNLDLAA